MTPTHPPSAHSSAEHSLTCQALVAQFSAYLDGEAPPDLCAAIEAQCAACDDCRAVLATLDATRRLTYALTGAGPARSDRRAAARLPGPPAHLSLPNRVDLSSALHFPPPNAHVLLMQGCSIHAPTSRALGCNLFALAASNYV